MNEPFSDSDRVWSISELTREVRGCLEVHFGSVWVQGEVSNLFSQASGHHYFTLKDSDSQLKAVLFRGDASRLQTLPQEGEQFVVFGDISVYEPRGEYQVRVRHVIGYGEGHLRREFEKLKKKLRDEGLFDPEEKQLLPQMPHKIAIVTSATGAAFQDFISILKRRDWRGEVLLFPSLVQGHEAPGEIIRAMKEAQEFPGVDLIVIGRGGGSTEDLWAFNDETLVRAVASCPIPIISAVGHQIDFALTDFAADFRAETPSAAAEKISSDFLRQRDFIQTICESMSERVSLSLDRASAKLEFAKARWKSQTPKSLVETLHQRLDEIVHRLNFGLKERLSNFSTKVDGLDQRLKGSSLNQTLKRGFAILRDKDGKPISSRSELISGQSLTATFADGDASLRVES